MDRSIPLIQHFDGGIIFLSYLISVVGAQTTLELFTRRTHFSGLYNWFLLTVAAFVMGGVSIWSMHFIGNQSLTIILPDGEQYQLSYAVGYTVSSLVVVIATMFIAFAFIGTTEDARLARIIPSGIFAGAGIATMHYLGQFAIQYFRIVYKVGFVVGAIIIACVAITVALYIFFKLREQWANQWYMRFVCSLIMALAVCGMHYTGLAGTDYYLPDLPKEELPPTPSLSTGGLIGIIASVVVTGCAFLFYVVFKNAINTLPSIQKRNANTRLMLGIVLFDSADKILVKIDGVVPTKEVSDNFEIGEITTKHPLFVRLFEVATRWANRGGLDSERPSVQSSAGTVSAFDVTERQFCDAARDLQDELRLPLLADLGLLFDTVVQTNTIVTKPGLFKYKYKNKNNKNNHNSKTDTDTETDTRAFRPYSAKNWLLWRPQPFSRSQSNQQRDEEEELDVYPKYNQYNPQKEWQTQAGNSQHQIGSQNICTIRSFEELGPKESKKSKNRYSDPNSKCSHTSDSRTIVQQSSEANTNSNNDQYIFLVKKLVRTKDLQRLLAQGYRFADPIYISKTMGAQLQVPVEHMLFYFKDMKLVADSLSSLVRHNFSSSIPRQLEPPQTLQQQQRRPSSSSSPGQEVPTDQQQQQQKDEETQVVEHLFGKETTKPGVYVGLFVLLDEDRSMENTHILVDKTRRFAFPMVQLKYTDTGEAPGQLTLEEKTCLNNLGGISLMDIARLDSQRSSSNPSGSGGMSQNSQYELGRVKSSNETLVERNCMYSTDTKTLGSENIFSSPPGSPTSPISPFQSSTYSNSLENSSPSVSARFTSALEAATRKLASTSRYSKPLGFSAKLHREVVDTPPFSLVVGPCQVILFKAHITTPGIISAINQTFSEPIKCVPLPIFHSIALRITDQAVDLYRQNHQINLPETSYLDQQRMYISSARPDQHDNSKYARQQKMMATENNSGIGEVIPLEERKSTTILVVNTAPADPSDTLASFSPLPPPPRAKKSRFALPKFEFESLRDSRSGSSESGGPSLRDLAAKPDTPPAMLNLLPSQDRFWWLNTIIEETLHDD
ncbi:hypothetical protein PHYBLDRAFT_142074 [Phycomyces blakesleeanus NRRL 1555(-)]|uniref:MHYT domain-containing protein n=1 Tax=Phycomyces blakesleeanus (strain ATCC 8743b / DSM 1359 / FGSC 10004 / NBRC 33097 / NRRL 1555) TaxID=763407 RepID=A0A162XUE9_PHYB8|nr:hypothetical protein PHYBLDRAFT_142074 [Phycomyces blakesleeanus NRRL 1555(-)]OAD76555.1 hypothetical protein PHYBLDRAFT_142074 [Phycomyces blakesleeanus NRRL 1555(-)]|eukprot:XP_018294595.1 hypothetical protein PHYBLDRAFT_142074 [Phycomyces blakesleeanus NRRL 1555(-)]